MGVKIKDLTDMINADFKLNIKKIFIITAVFALFIYVINFFGNIKNAKVIENVNITISLNNNSSDDRIKVLKIDRKNAEFYLNKSSSDNKWIENKNYIKKIIIEAPELFKDQIAQVTLTLGKKNFNFTKDDFFKKWITDNKKQDIIKSGIRYKLYQSPSDLIYKKSFIPLYSGIINWPGDLKILLYTFNLTFLLQIIMLIIILLFLFILKEIIKYRTGITADQGKIEFKEKMSTAVLVSLFFSSIFFFGPFQIFFTNFDEFEFTFARMLPLMSAGFILIFLMIMLLILLLYRFKSYSETISLLFAFALLLWIQGNILVWKYGIFDGSDIKWNKYIINGIIDSSIWIILIFTSILYSKFVYKNIKTVSIIILIMQLSLFAINLTKLPEMPGYKKYSIDKKSLFNFSKEKNVILLTLDEYQSDVFNEIINEDIFYKEIFKDFIFYDDCTSVYFSTHFSVPSFLTGAYYDGSRTQNQFVKEEFLKQSVPKLLIENGFNVDMLPQNKPTILFDKKTISNIIPKKNIDAIIEQFYLYDITLFRYLPHFFKKYIYNNEKWFLKRIVLKIKYLSEKKEKTSGNLFNDHVLEVSEDARFINEMVLRSGTNSKVNKFKYYHINGPHPALVVNENFEPVTMKYSRANYKKQAKAALKAVKMFLDKMKDLGIYENSLIVIISDHGSGRSPDMLINYNKVKIHNDSDDNYKKFEYDKARSQALMLIKRINYRGGFKVDDAPVILTDIPKTIASELNLDSQFSGYSVFDKNIPYDRKRQFNGKFNEYNIQGNSKEDSNWSIIKGKTVKFTIFQ